MRRTRRSPTDRAGAGAAAASVRQWVVVPCSPRRLDTVWSVVVAVLESEFPGDPAGHARHIVAQTTAGSILLAHDIGNPDRLVAIEGLPDLVAGLRGRGFEFVTVSDLMAADTVAV